MPATLIADGWRRFGWAGVAGIFFPWAWLLAKASLALRFRPHETIKALFASSVAANVVLQYTADFVSLCSSIPRRIIVICAYVAIVMLLGGFLELRQRSRRKENAASLVGVRAPVH